MSKIMTTLKTASGQLTRYALSCGYVEFSPTTASTVITLWREHGVYHVRAHNHETGQREAWRVFRTLTAARRFYRRQGGR
jgi:hypothetical protein